MEAILLIFLGLFFLGLFFYAISNRNQKYQSFDNIILKTPDGTTQIDKIIVSPHGIFVIEEKDINGWIFGGEKQKKWTQSLYTRTSFFFRIYDSVKYQFQNPLHQNFKHLKAVQKFFCIDMKSIFSIVVFTGNCEFKTRMPDNVVYLGNFKAHLRSYTDQVISSETVEQYSQKLREYKDNCTITDSEHITNIKKNFEHPICPECGKQMVLRTARKGKWVGSKFWGCPNFPSCKVTKKVVKSLN